MDNNFHLQFPFTKINRDKRIVVGIATADNVDKADDIVDYDASVNAFANWVGNIREMHSPKAVGKALSYTPIEIKNDDGSVHRGIQVEAYVSKGAEDTWQKVLDGTLTGFSIGGTVGETKKEFHSKLNKMVRRITKYALGELSLVDNPCNPAAQISVVKNYNGTLMYDLDVDDVEKAERNPRSDRASATPAPPKDRVRGSEKNPENSAASSSSGRSVELSEAAVNGLKNKIKEHNKKVEGKEDWRKASLASLKSVYRRGAGAYSVSHRPGMTRNQWAMARVNAFLTLLATGSPKNARYTTDNDLLPSGHPKKTEKSSQQEMKKAENYTPPAGVRAEARRALQWLKEGEAGGGFTDVGRRRASQLANGQPVSLDTIKRMASYLARHQVDKQGKGWSPGEEGYPSPGRVAWAAWGGDPAVSWTNRVLRSANAVEKVAMAELEYVEAMLEIVEEYGKLADNDGNGIWVGYESAEENEQADIGVKCENCYFYIGDGECSIIAQEVEPEGYCRLAAIPSKDIDINTEMEANDMEKADFSPAPVTPSADTDFTALLGRFRALSLFYQQAHWAVKGTNFYGDHLLFERLYDEVSSTVDEIAEKGIGATGSTDHVSLDNQVVALYSFTKDMENANVSNAEFAQCALDFEESLSVWLADSNNAESNLGIQNMLQGFVDAGITRIYLLRRYLNDIEQSGREESDMGMPLMRSHSNEDVYFCESCGIATYKDSVCSTCENEMVLIGEVKNFEYENVAKMIQEYMNLHKNTKNDSITNMKPDSSAINSAAAELLAKVAASMIPQIGIFGSKSSPEGEDLVKQESDALEEDSEGGEDVNTDELLKSLAAMIDGKLDEFKTEISAVVDEKVEAVAKSVEVAPEVEADSLEKSDEVAGEDEKDALIKSLTERIEKLEDTGAVKKSLDDDGVDGDDEVITKSTTSIWEGIFVPLEVVHALGYES